MWYGLQCGTTAVQQLDYGTTAIQQPDCGTTATRQSDYGTTAIRLHYEHDKFCTISMRLWYDCNTTIWHAYDTSGNRLGSDCNSAKARLRYLCSTTIKRVLYDCMRLWHDYGTNGIRLQYDYGPTAGRLRLKYDFRTITCGYGTTPARLRYDCTTTKAWLCTTAKRPQHDCRVIACNNGTTPVRTRCDCPTAHNSIVSISRRKSVSQSYSSLTWSIRCIDPWPFWRKHEQGESNKHGGCGVSNETKK